MTESQAIAQNLMITRTIMFTTILVAITSIIFSSITMAFERSHNVKSLRSFINLLQVSNPNKISLTIDNAGLGPMMIKRLTFIPKNGLDVEGKTLAEILPDSLGDADIFTFSEVFVVAAHDKLKIFEYTTDKNGEEQVRQIKSMVNDFTVRIDYQDVYDHQYQKENAISLQ